LRNKQYCIFNKQYSKQEYENIVPTIIAQMQETSEWGEFFDPSISPFGYNETVANEYFPLSKQEATTNGYKWQDNSYDPKIPADARTLTGDEIFLDSTALSDDILKNIFICEIS
jgi:hypothetical protein